jgi:hypothetical protein
LTERDLKTVQDEILKCADNRVKWWHVIAAIFSLVTGMWAVANTKVDVSAFNEYTQNALHIRQEEEKHLCHIDSMLAKIYNQDLPVDKQLPEPACNEGAQ